MNEDLAERLLAAVMDWTPEEDADERPKLADLAYYKYNQYQQFSPGMRFIESLALWLNQFEPGEERRLAYRFVRDKLVFISQAEMSHLVGMVFPDIVQGVLLNEVSGRTGLPATQVRQLARHGEYQLALRQSLFLGLSDGARMDVFRRSAPELTNEQVWLTYEISDEKAQEMRGQLASDLHRILEREPTEQECKFRLMFLLDDFTASGISYFRTEDGLSKGKLAKTLNRVLSGDLNGLVSDDVRICVIFYLATAKAMKHVRSLVQGWCDSDGGQRTCEVCVIQELPSDISVVDNDSAAEWLEAYTDTSIVDGHFKKGKYDRPYYGFDECGLPLILYHNTPNNSLPVLWQEEWRKVKGLFPRVSRHSREL